MPRRIQLSRRKGWRLPPGAVSVARPTRWGNPYRVADARTAAEAVDAFTAWLAQPDQTALVAAIRADLRGRDLACWCPLDGQPCHADVLLRMANEEGAP